MKSVQKMIQSPITASVLITIFIFLCIIGFRNMGHLEFLELAAYDQYLRLNTPVFLPDSRIVLITVSETDIQILKEWPLTDSSLAHILELIISMKPRVIGLDIYRDIPVPPGKEHLVDIFSRYHNIVTVKNVADVDSQNIQPPYFLNNTDLVGFNDILIDTGGTVRRGLLFLNDGEDISSSFSLLLALLYLKAEGISPQPDKKIPEHLRLGKTTIVPFESNDGGYVNADARGYQFLLDFRTSRSPFRNISLKELNSGQTDPNEINDKIVIFGAVAESLHDFFYTPLSRGHRFNQKISGIELHAHMTSQILRYAIEGTKPIKSLNDWYEWLWILIWGLLGGLLATWRHSLLRVSLMVIIGMLLLGLITFFMFKAGLWIPIVPPALIYLISAGAVTAFCAHQEKVQKALLMQIFSKHVSENVAKAIWEQRDQFMDDGRPRSQGLIATVLFADLKGFTSISEKLYPEDLMNWLNEYIEGMAQIIIGHGGVVNKYIGDGIMAVFGVPLARTNKAEISQDAVNAVDCALEMSKKIRQINRLWQKQNMPTTHMRIGIFSGQVVAGTIGSQKRMEYTVIGDTVNIASRLESFQKDIEEQNIAGNECRIFIGDSTFHYLGGQFHTKKVGTSGLKGKKEPIIIYKVTGKKD